MKKWFPSNATGRYSMSRLVDEGSCLTICLVSADTTKNISLQFEKPLMYRLCDESFVLNFPDKSDIDGMHSLYLFQNSELIKWMKNESRNSVTTEEVFHYIIITDEEYIDVLSFDEPNNIKCTQL